MPVGTCHKVGRDLLDQGVTTVERADLTTLGISMHKDDSQKRPPKPPRRRSRSVATRVPQVVTSTSLDRLKGRPRRRSKSNLEIFTNVSPLKGSIQGKRGGDEELKVSDHLTILKGCQLVVSPIDISPTVGLSLDSSLDSSSNASGNDPITFASISANSGTPKRRITQPSRIRSLHSLWHLPHLRKDKVYAKDLDTGKIFHVDSLNRSFTDQTSRSRKIKGELKRGISFQERKMDIFKGRKDGKREGNQADDHLKKEVLAPQDGIKTDSVTAMTTSTTVTTVVTRTITSNISVSAPSSPAIPKFVSPPATVTSSPPITKSPKLPPAAWVRTRLKNKNRREFARLRLVQTLSTFEGLDTVNLSSINDPSNLPLNPTASIISTTSVSTNNSAHSSSSSISHTANHLDASTSKETDSIKDGISTGKFRTRAESAKSHKSTLSFLSLQSERSGSPKIVADDASKGKNATPLVSPQLPPSKGPMPTTSAGGPVWVLKFNRDGKFLAAACQDLALRVWAVNIQTTSLSHATDLEDDDPGSQTPQARRSRSVVTRIFADAPVQTFWGHTKDFLDVAWSRNNFIVSSAMDMTVRLWHVSKAECLCVFKHNDYVAAVSFHPTDDRLFVTCTLEGKIRLTWIPSKSVLHSVDLPIMGDQPEFGLLTSVTFALDGRMVIVGTYSGYCLFYETLGLVYNTQILVRSRKGKNAKGSKINGLEYIRGQDDLDDDKLMVTSNDSRIRVYNMRDKSLEFKYKGCVNSSMQIQAKLSEDSRHIVCGSEDGNVYVWDSLLARRASTDKDLDLDAGGENASLMTSGHSGEGMTGNTPPTLHSGYSTSAASQGSSSRFRVFQKSKHSAPSTASKDVNDAYEQFAVSDTKVTCAIFAPQNLQYRILTKSRAVEASPHLNGLSASPSPSGTPATRTRGRKSPESVTSKGSVPIEPRMIRRSASFGANDGVVIATADYNGSIKIYMNDFGYPVDESGMQVLQIPRSSSTQKGLNLPDTKPGGALKVSGIDTKTSTGSSRSQRMASPEPRPENLVTATPPLSPEPTSLSPALGTFTKPSPEMQMYSPSMPERSPSASGAPTLPARKPSRAHEGMVEHADRRRISMQSDMPVRPPSFAPPPAPKASSMRQPPAPTSAVPSKPFRPHEFSLESNPMSDPSDRASSDGAVPSSDWTANSISSSNVPLNTFDIRGNSSSTSGSFGYRQPLRSSSAQRTQVSTSMDNRTFSQDKQLKSGTQRNGFSSGPSPGMGTPASQTSSISAQLPRDNDKMAKEQLESSTGTSHSSVAKNMADSRLESVLAPRRTHSPIWIDEARQETPATDQLSTPPSPISSGMRCAWCLNDDQSTFQTISVAGNASSSIVICLKCKKVVQGL